MKETLKIRQEIWEESPCSLCSGTPCCGNLPLAPARLENRSDFITLLMISSYGGFFPGLKESGEWTIFLKRNCSFHNLIEKKCTIHGLPEQSLICKSYNAHNCWYIDAFNIDRYMTMIPFNTAMLIWLEKKYRLMETGFDEMPEWEELCRDAEEFRYNTFDIRTDLYEPWNSRKLTFRESRSEKFLFMPPYNRPENINHFELLTFRLGFPGVYLAVSDSSWAFLIATDINGPALDLIRREYFPAITHEDSAYSFSSVMKQYHPYSETGEQWVILKKTDLPVLKHLTVFGNDGRVKRLPGTSELLKALGTRRPDRAA